MVRAFGAHCHFGLVHRNNSEASSKREPDEEFPARDDQHETGPSVIARVVAGLKDHGRLGRFVANAG